jgi:hypothetical protein
MSKKISQLTTATDVTASDLFQMVDVEDGIMAPSGTNKKVTAQLLANELADIVSNGSINPAKLSSGALPSGITATATGSTTARTLANRFADVVNVKDFGAKGNGSDDDTEAFTQAAATGLQVFIPSGNYNLSTDVTGYWVIAYQVFWAGAGKAVVQELGYFPDVGNGANIHRLRDRLFINDGSGFTGNRYGTQGGFVPAGPDGANWAPRDSSLFVAQDNGLMAVTGFASNTNIDVSVGQPTETIGVSGFVIGNKANRSVWALYSDVQYEVGDSAWGLEIAVKNKSVNDFTATPYYFVSGACGIWLPAGGDDVYGGSPTYPNNFAIGIGTNSSTWNKGIVFFKNGLTGSDGTTGTATAIEMAKGHSIVWRNFGGVAMTIRSDSTSGASPISLLSTNNTFTVAGLNDSPISDFVHSSNAVNYLRFQNATSGNLATIRTQGSDANVAMQIRTKGTAPIRFQSQDSGANDEFRIGGIYSSPVNYLHAYGSNSGDQNPTIFAAGTDANINLRLTPKGTGLVRFGSHASSGDTSITGYITILDDSGNQRKLAVIS